MTPTFLFWIALISVVALAPILLPLLRGGGGGEDEAGRAARKQRNALAAARAAGVLSQDEYDAKLATLPVVGTAPMRPARGVAILLVVALPLIALLLYREVGEPRALDPAALATPVAATATPDLATAIAGLERRLAATPEDADGLRLLARGYQSMQRFADAKATLAQVRALLPDDVDVQVEYAEALALASDSRRIDGEAASLLDDALAKNPQHERGLWLGGIAAMQRDDREQALRHWQQLARLLPPDSEVYAAVADQIRGIGGDVPAAAGSANSDAPVEAVPATDATQAAAIRVQVRVSDTLRGRVGAADTVYVFARAAVGPKMPLAIQRFAASELPKLVLLDDSMGMTPALKLSQQDRIVVGARISKSGDATPQPGDFQGLSTVLDRNAIRSVIDLEVADIVD